jgi:phage head maturation protease
LAELELWEVSLVTFPMLQDARVQAKGQFPGAETWRDVAAILRNAAGLMAGR